MYPIIVAFTYDWCIFRMSFIIVFASIGEVFSGDEKVQKGIGKLNE